MVVVAQVVSQLQDPTVTDWVSDSSMSKTAHGRLSKVEKSKNGLQLELDNGKKVSWRMPEKIADNVIATLKWVEQVCEVARSMDPTDEIGVEEIYDDTMMDFTEQEQWLQKNNW